MRALARVCDEPLMEHYDDRDDKRVPWPTSAAFRRVRAPPLVAYVDARDSDDAELAVAAHGRADVLAHLVTREHYEFRPALASDARHAQAAAPPAGESAGRLLLWFARDRDALDDDGRRRDEFPWPEGARFVVFGRDSRDPVARVRLVGTGEQRGATGRAFVDVERWASARARALFEPYTLGVG